MKRPKISLILGTARPSEGSLLDDDVHLMHYPLTSLAKQGFTDFELIVVDSLFNKRNLLKEMRVLGDWSFPIKVVPNPSFWLKEGLWALQGAFNSGARAASGDWFLFCGDCCEFTPYTLEMVNGYITRGHGIHILVVYKRGDYIKKNRQELTHFKTLEDARLNKEEDQLELWRDSRFSLFQPPHFAPVLETHWSQFYGYCCLPREDFFALNGWDEAFDGDKALGDVELGSRLEMSGRLNMAVDMNCFLYEHDHYGIDQEMFRWKNRPSFKSNYDLIYLKRVSQDIRANNRKYTKEEGRLVFNARITGHPNWPKYSEITREQQLWLDHTPVYDVKETPDAEVYSYKG